MYLFRDFYETVKEDSLRSRAKQGRRVTETLAPPVTARTERTWPLGSPYYQVSSSECLAFICEILELGCALLEGSDISDISCGGRGL